MAIGATIAARGTDRFDIDADRLTIWTHRGAVHNTSRAFKLSSNRTPPLTPSIHSRYENAAVTSIVTTMSAGIGSGKRIPTSWCKRGTSRTVHMGYKSEIEWTDATWNPVTGCTKVSGGCDNCYAERLAERFRGTPGHPYEHGFDLQLRPERLTHPLSWRRPRRIFVNSMSDLFHKDVPTEYVDRVFHVMEEADWHVFQLLTKRSSTMRNYLKRRYVDRTAPRHLWFGVSVEDHSVTVRIEHLQAAPAAIRFLSIEPLIGPVGALDLEGIAWVIVGGESGPNARRMEESWILDIKDQCERDGVHFFFKQWGGSTPKSGGRLLQNEEYNAMPLHFTNPHQRRNHAIQVAS